VYLDRVHASVKRASVLRACQVRLAFRHKLRYFYGVLAVLILVMVWGTAAVPSEGRDSVDPASTTTTVSHRARSGDKRELGTHFAHISQRSDLQRDVHQQQEHEVRAGICAGQGAAIVRRPTVAT
jgi:hypothetical protein